MKLGLELVSENSETLGGFIIELLGDLPDEEEKEDKVIEYENLVFKIGICQGQTYRKG